MPFRQFQIIKISSRTTIKHHQDGYTQSIYDIGLSLYIPLVLCTVPLILLSAETISNFAPSVVAIAP